MGKKIHRARCGSTGATSPGSVCSLIIFPASPVTAKIRLQSSKGTLMPKEKLPYYDRKGYAYMLTDNRSH